MSDNEKKAPCGAMDILKCKECTPDNCEAMKVPLEIKDEWQRAALLVGEQLSNAGPDNYYSMSADEWKEWALKTVECVRSEKDAEIEVLREGIALAKAHLVFAKNRAGDIERCRNKIDDAVFVLNNSINYMPGQSRPLMDALNNANEVLRSAYAIADRKGQNVSSWEGFRARINKVLFEQREILQDYWMEKSKELLASVESDTRQPKTCKGCDAETMKACDGRVEGAEPGKCYPCDNRKA